jgi:hypothetical protein
MLVSPFHSRIREHLYDRTISLRSYHIDRTVPTSNQKIRGKHYSPNKHMRTFSFTSIQRITLDLARDLLLTMPVLTLQRVTR